jgi:small subunit ribosomal protein S4
MLRKFGNLPGFTQKLIKNCFKTPGQHGKLLTIGEKRSSLSDYYKDQLFEKQKVRFNYGLSEKQLFSYYLMSKRTNNSLLALIEQRLDCILYRLGLASTIPFARQIINHGHILVNTKRITIPSYLCKVGDFIQVAPRDVSKKLIEKNFKEQQVKRELVNTRVNKFNIFASNCSYVLPTHLQLDTKTLTGKVISNIRKADLLIKVNELKIIEFYSR